MAEVLKLSGVVVLFTAVVGWSLTASNHPAAAMWAKACIATLLIGMAFAVGEGLRHFGENGKRWRDILHRR